MNNYLKKNISIILSIFILMQPVLDLITGLCIHLLDINITFGIVIRILFLIFMLYMITFVYKKKKTIGIFLIVGLYWILYLIGIIIYKDGGFFQEIQGLVKIFYFPLLLLSFYSIKDDIKISKATLFTTLVIYIAFIFIPIIFGVGYKTYEITKAGTLGFFNSANEISGILSILTPIMFIILKEKKFIIPKVILMIAYLIVILTVGTKTPILSLGITIIATIIYLVVKNAKEKKYKPVLISFLVLVVGIVGLVIVIPKTNFYKNIETHLNYLKLDSIDDVFEKPKYIDHFIFSSRLSFLGKEDKLYQKASTYQKLFGIGYIHNNKPTKLIEMDYFDIFYCHGVVGFIIFFLIYLTILLKIIKEKSKFSFDKYMLSISLFLIIFLSLFTGHIITAPSVSLLVISIILMLGKKHKKELLFTAYNLDIGGIETALVNLLKNINLNKNNVTVILEKKQGVFLSEVPNNVTVTEIKVSTNKNIFVRKLTNMLRKVNFWIFNYKSYDFSCCYATYSLSGNKLALMASNNNSIYVHSNYKDLYKEKDKFKGFFNSRKINKFNKIIFVSNESKDDFLKVYSELSNKSIVLNNFIDIDKIKNLSKEKIKEENNSKDKLLVFVGRLDDSSKKLSRAINIVKEIKGIRLWIVGSGPDEKMYKDLVKKEKLESKIAFLGRKKNPYPYMLKADYIILTSDYEGFPVTYLESIVLEKEIITTIPTSDDKINIKDYAYVISKNTTKEVEEVKEILKKKDKSKKINLESIQKARMKDFEAIFNEVI